MNIMILYYSYLGHSGDTVVIYNLKLETKSGKIFTKGISLEILSREYHIGNHE